MMISTKGRYALRVMIYLALHGRDQYIPLKAITDKEEISIKYLEAIIAVLNKAGLVEGVRGKGGGYRLTRAPGDYTVGSILKLTEGTLAPVACLECQSNTCKRASSCPTLPMWKKLNTLIDNFFAEITLEDLANEAIDPKSNDHII